MAKVKGGLGRGLDSLLANGADNSSGDRLTAVAVKDIHLPLSGARPNR